MPTFAKYVKTIDRTNRVTTDDPGEIARLRSQGYVEEKPKQKAATSSGSSAQSGSQSGASDKSETKKSSK